MHLATGEAAVGNNAVDEADTADNADLDTRKNGNLDTFKTVNADKFCHTKTRKKTGY